MTSQDCYEVARRKTTIITSQRKLHRLLKAISEKERYAALYQSKFMCERYDSEIESLYDKVAFLEGHVMANELELEHIEAKRREAETQRLVRLFQFTAPTLDPAAPTPPASSRPRTEQLAMFGPGPAPIANELELAHIEAKRREAETQRLVRLFQLTAPTLEPAAPTPTLQASSTPRAEQLAMFGPGPAPIDTKPVGNRSASDREWAIESDIAMGMELAN